MSSSVSWVHAVAAAAVPVGFTATSDGTTFRPLIPPWAFTLAIKALYAVRVAPLIDVDAEALLSEARSTYGMPTRTVDAVTPDVGELAVAEGAVRASSPPMVAAATVPTVTPTRREHGDAPLGLGSASARFRPVDYIPAV